MRSATSRPPSSRAQACPRWRARRSARSARRSPSSTGRATCSQSPRSRPTTSERSCRDRAGARCWTYVWRTSWWASFATARAVRRLHRRSCGWSGRSSRSSSSARAAAEDARGLVVVVPATPPELPRRAAESIHRELQRSLSGYEITVAVSRPAGDPVDVPRAGVEAILAANVAEAERRGFLAFEETGSYRLLLPVLTDDPSELQRFHDETIEPLVTYDEQYDTELVRTLETFLDEDGSVARTAQELYTHRHTIRYRLERVRELTGLDVGSTDGRERLSLGLKAMRVLGIMPPRGPASEPGAEAGQVPQEEPDR